MSKPELADFFNSYFQFEKKYNGAPVCREERQYALFLYNRLEKLLCKSVLAEDPILTSCGIGDAGQSVVVHWIAYEVTLMRDIFFAEQQIRENELKGRKIRTSAGVLDCFNKRLYEYVYKKLNGEDAEVPDADWDTVPADRHLGTNKKNTGIKQGPMEKCLLQMMNSKPDLAVVYSAGTSENAPRYLKLIECKYLTPASRAQIKAQEDIGDFLCKRIAENICFGGVQLVRFRDENQRQKPVAGSTLSLSELLS